MTATDTLPAPVIEAELGQPAGAIAPAPTAALPTPGGGFLMGNPVALQAQLDAYSRGRKIFIDWVFANLTPGVDWLTIHTRVKRGGWIDCPNKNNRTMRRCDVCNGKPTLCKPGAEKIMGLLHMKADPQIDKEMAEAAGNPPGVLFFKVVLINQDTGQEMSIGRGSAKGAEGKDYGDAPPKEDWNKAVKMGQKRAITDAVLRCAGLSEAFTQDLESSAGVPEDDYDDNPPAAPTATRPSPPPRPSGRPANSAPPKPAPPPADLDQQLIVLVGALPASEQAAVITAMQVPDFGARSECPAPRTLLVFELFTQLRRVGKTAADVCKMSKPPARDLGEFDDKRLLAAVTYFKGLPAKAGPKP